MESAVQRIIVFGPAVRAHRERGHRGQGPIIRHIGNNGKTGTAVCAVYKGISIPPVLGIEQLLATCIACGNIGGYQDISSLCLAFADFKTKVAVRRNRLLLHLLDPGEGRGQFNKVPTEEVEGRRGAFHLHHDTGGGVQDPSLHLVPCGKAVNEGSKAYPLNNTFDVNTQSRGGSIIPSIRLLARDSSHSAHAGDPFAGPAGDLKEFCPGIEGRYPLTHGIELEIHVGRQIDLVQDDRIHGRKNAGILVRFVVSFGNTGNDDTDLLTQLKFHGTDQVSHVFDEEYVDLIKRERL